MFKILYYLEFHYAHVIDTPTLLTLTEMKSLIHEPNQAKYQETKHN